MKRCSIFKTEKEYKIHTESETDIGLFICDAPIFILPVKSDIENIKDAIFECLNNSRKGIYTPKVDEWSDWGKECLKKLKEKSHEGLDKRSNYVCIELEKDILTIYPGKHTPRKGFSTVEEDVVKMEYFQEKEIEITKRIIEMLEVDYKQSCK